MALKRSLVKTQAFKEILMRAQKERWRAVENASIIQENIYILMNRMGLEIRTLKMLPVGFQKEMMNVLLGTRGKAILVTKWQRTWLKCVLLNEKQNL